MSAKDSQFIERALVHPWMFWVFFWKWPRIVRQICSEYDLVARDRDAAKAAHEQAIAANEKVRKWIHVTHQLDATADLRAIWTAGKRLSILLALFIATNAFGQAPPYLRNQWTTNANPIAVKVISTNGVQAATNVWALDFTNTASVSVNVVSNAGKVVFSFIGATNSGGSSSLTNALLHAGPTNGSVNPLILTAGNGVTLTTSGTNRIAAIDTNVVAEVSDLNWTNFTVTDYEGGTVYGIADTNLNGSSASFAMNFLTNFWGEPSEIILLGRNSDGTPYDHRQIGVHVIAIGLNALSGASVTNSRKITAIGPDSLRGVRLYNTTGIMGMLSSFGSSRITNGNGIFGVGASAFEGSDIWNSVNLFGFGNQALDEATISNCFSIYGVGNNALGFTASGIVIRNSDNINGFGEDSMKDAIIENSDQIFATGIGAGQFSKLTNCFGITFIGWRAGTNLTMTAKTNIVLFGNVGTILPANDEFWFGNTNNISRFPGNVVIRTAAAPTVGQILTATDTLGTAGWSNAPSGSGGGIASVYTNNVLAGGPGLTELEFTNSASVSVNATTNAGRVTMSFDATGTAAASGTNWMLQFNNNGSFGGTTGMLWRVNQLLVPDGGNAIPGIGFMGFTNTGIYAAAGPSRLGFDIAGFDYVVIRADRNSTVLRNGGGYEWSPNNDTTSTADTRLSRNAAATVEINNGTVGSRGNLLARTVTATNFVGNAYSSSATNRIAITATGYTNTMTVFGIAVDVDVYFDAATATVSDPAGNTMHTFQAGTNITVHLKPNWRLAGTTMAGTAIAH